MHAYACLQCMHMHMHMHMHACACMHMHGCRNLASKAYRKSGEFGVEIGPFGTQVSPQGQNFEGKSMVVMKTAENLEILWKISNIQQENHENQKYQFTHTSTHICIYIYKFMHKHLYMQMSSHTNRHIYMRRGLCEYIHNCIRAHVNTYTHTHTYWQI